jgi:UDPglucose 6-dehydrogenase
MFKIKKYLILLVCFYLTTIQASQITIVGCGYVGLTMAALFSEVESNIVCFDIDKKKIETLKNSKTPIFEPGLSELLFETSTSHHLRFTDNLLEAMQSNVFFICVPTPSNDNGHCDCTYLFKAFDDILEHCPVEGKKIICVKSTVSPGTMKKLHKRLDEADCNDIHLIYNPEFMREGSALYDVRYRNPVVLASTSEDALQMLESMYRKMLSSASCINFIKTDYASAEVIKYAWNSFSAIRITYVNELAFLCRKLGANIYPVIQGIALSEELLPTKKLLPGPGYGGSCLPKDTRGFSKIIEGQGMQESLVHQAIKSNANHVKQLIEDIFLFLDDFTQEQTVAFLGLSFKANTNDIRNSSAIPIIDALQKRGVLIKAFDPKANEEMKGLYPQVMYCSCPYEAATNADCIVALTEWDQIKHIDLGRIANICRSKVLIDARNLFDVEGLEKHGYRYINMGKL